MDIDIVVTPDGKINIFTRSGTFAQGKKAIMKLIEALKVHDIELQNISPAEQHRHEHQQIPVVIKEKTHAH
jgi:hypothetical protein